jgi:hypothetical protein
VLEPFLVASFADPPSLLRAVRRARAAGVPIHDVFCPTPVHGLDEAMGIRRTRLPLCTLLAGLLGLTFAFVFQYWTAVLDWPLDVGGKPESTTLAFVPICFELTVLVGGLGTAGAFFLRARLYPGKREELPVLGVTNNVFALVVPAPADRGAARRLRELLAASGASEVEEREGEREGER